MIQCQSIGGNVSFSTGRLPCRIEWFSAEPRTISVDEAREQPSRLLSVECEVVPFDGRRADEELLAVWLDSDAQMAIHLVYGPGGQGKTRLAARVARGCMNSGWSVARLRHDAMARENWTDEPSRGGLFVVVDYADRWPMPDLLTTLTELRNLSDQTGLVVRVLLLARSHGIWWSAVEHRVDRDLRVPASAHHLGPLGDEVDRGELFATACDRFAKAVALEPLPRQSSAKLDDSAYGQILAIHITALAAVDAARRGEVAPMAPHAASKYVLQREMAHWQLTHNAGKVAGPTTLRRIVYLATLVGPTDRSEAHAVLSRADVATDPERLDGLVDDHAALYPARDPLTVLEPLLPDRLAEDFIGLTIPDLTDEQGLPTDNWVCDATPRMLTADSASWGWKGVRVLVETSRRWPHVATTVLYPLLRDRPDLADATAIVRLAQTPGVDRTVLEAVERALPSESRYGYDIAALAIAQALRPHRLTETTEPLRVAEQNAQYAKRLGAVGQYAEAIELVRGGVTILRAAPDVDNRWLLSCLLHDLAHWLSEWGDSASALAPAQEALAIRRQLTTEDGLRVRLAPSLGLLGSVLARLNRWNDALMPAQEAVELYRATNADPAHTAQALANMATILSRTDDAETAGAKLREAGAVLWDLMSQRPTFHMKDVAPVLLNFAQLSLEAGETDQARKIARRAAVILRLLAEDNPRYLGMLATALTSLRRVAAEHDIAALLTEEISVRARMAVFDKAGNAERIGKLRHELATHHVSAGQWAQALAAAEDLCRHTDDEGRTAALEIVVQAARALGRWALADLRQQELIQLARRHEDENLGQSPSALAQYLAESARVLARLDRAEDRKTALANAVYTELACLARTPESTLAYLAGSLNVGGYLSELGRWEEAWTHALNAVRLAVGLAEDPATRVYAGMALANAGPIQWMLGNHEDAVNTIVTAAQLYRSCAGPDRNAALATVATLMAELWRDCVRAEVDEPAVFAAIAEILATDPLPDGFHALHSEMVDFGLHADAAKLSESVWPVVRVRACH